MTATNETDDAAYPWSEKEMIARYGLRRLDEVEQGIFPGLRLVRDVCKVSITRPPPAVPRVRAGYVVWVAETYPGRFHIRLPGGAILLAPYHDLAWTPVPVETPATTVADVRAELARLQAEAAKWRPGQTITTPGTRLSWNSLAGWLAAWQQLQNRAHSSRRYQQEDQHLRALPVEMITAESNETVLYAFLDLMHGGDARPPKGRRGDHPTTPLVVAAHNRLAQLNTPAYRKYRQQHPRLREVLRQAPAGPAGTSPNRQQPAGGQTASHLSLF